MIWFDKKRIPPGNWPFMNTVRAGLAEIELALEPQIDLTEGNEEILITGCIRVYRRAVMKRILDLSQSIVVTWNSGFPVGSIVCARSLLETIATFHSFVKRAEVLAATKDWESIGKLVDLYAFSTSSGPKAERSRHGKLQKIVEGFISDTQPGLEHFWDQICDTAHPNGKRMLNYAGVLSNKSYVAKAAEDIEPDLFVAVFNALHSICWLIGSETDFEILLAVIRNGGELPSEHHLIIERIKLDEISAVGRNMGKIRGGPI